MRGMIEPDIRRLMIALTDISGFAKACRGKSDIETFQMLDQYYDIVAKTVEPAGGRIVKLMGDSVLICFSESDAVKGVNALRKLREQAAEIWREPGLKCDVGFKACIGEVACGAIGPGNTFDIVGNTVNELFLMPSTGPEISDDLRLLLDQPSTS